MNPERSNASNAHEDERTRDRRERRAVDRAIADERILAANRFDALLPFSVAPVDIREDDTGFAPGCHL